MARLWFRTLFSLILFIPTSYAQTQNDKGFVSIAKTDGTSACYGWQLKTSTAPTDNGDGTCTIPGGGGGTPSAPTNSVQYNNGGSFGGNAGFIFVAPNVGIGSATPGQILDVTGTIRSTQLIDTGLTASVPVITTATKQLASGTYSGNTTEFATTTGSQTNGNFVSIDSNGNHVASGTANTAAGIVGLFSTCSGTQYLGADGSCHNAGGSAAGGTNAVQYNSGSSTFAGKEQVFSMNGTNVGIGTTNGINLLDVQGTVKANSFEVTGPGNVGIGTALVTKLLQVQGDSLFNSVNYAQFNSSFTPGTGGTITTSGGNTIHTFNSSGTFVAPNQNVTVTYLVVAGGGGGGRNVANGVTPGAGGAGGYLTGTALVTANSSYTITVGAGGGGSTTDNTNGSAGNNSVFTGIATATGGGGGQGLNASTGGNGGSGGGSVGTHAPGTGTAGQGNNGGSGDSNGYGGGGGGGAGAVGGTSAASGGSGPAGAGGTGLSSSISGSSVCYAGGGGGGAYTGATGGTATCGGSAGGANGGTASNATANTGGGGGGAGNSNGSSGSGGNGGSGIVIISYSPPSTNTVIYANGAIGVTTNTNVNNLDVNGNAAIGSYAGVNSAPANGLLVSGNVGIGSATPGQILDVQGTVRALNFVGPGAVPQLSAGQVPYAASAGDTLVGTSNLISNGTNIGIGSATPGQLLDVAGSLRLTGFVLTAGAGSGKVLTSDGGGGGTWQAASGGGSGTVNTGTATDAAYYATSTTAVSPTASLIFTGNAAGNNIGINSASPGQTLDVMGTIRSVNSGNAEFDGNVGIGTSLAPKNGLDVAGSVSIGTTNAGYFAAPTNGLAIQGNVGIGTYLPTGIFEVGLQKFDIVGSNVGIGTISPQSALTLGGNAHLGSTGTAPTVASNDCGSTAQGTVNAGSTDLKGQVVVGTLTVTSCAVTFNVPFGRAPICETQDDTNILGIKNSQTTTKITVTSTTSMSGDTITWLCIE